MEPQHSETSNRILSALATDDFANLKSKLTFVDLPVRRQLELRNKPMEYVYFLESGLASTVVSTGAHQTIEIGIFGFDGMTGLSLLHETDRALHETFMQSAGQGWRIPAADLRAAMQASATLRTILIHYAHVATTQTAFTALANGRYKIEERLARWLLMAHDRLPGDVISLTHEFLSVMLGTRRPGVTTALAALAKRSLIKSERGAIHILDRAGLQEASNGSYGGPEGEFQRLFGAPIRREA